MAMGSAGVLNPPMQMLNAVSSMFVMPSDVARFMVGPEAVAAGVADDAVRAIRGDAEPGIFVPGARYQVIDREKGIVQFGSEPASRAGIYHDQPIERLAELLRVPRLPEPRQAAAHLRFNGTASPDAAPSEIVYRRTLMQLFSGLASVGGVLENIIPNGAADDARTRRFFESTLIARFAGESVELKVRIPAQFERLPFLAHMQLGVHRKEGRFALKYFSGADSVEIGARLLHDKDRTSPDGFELLETGLRKLLMPFVEGKRDVFLDAKKGDPDSMKLSVSSDVPVPDSLPALCIGERGIFTGAI